MTAAQRANGWLRRVPAPLVYLAGLLYAAWLFWRALSGASVEPVNWLERAYGLTALRLLVATLLVTPLRRWTGVSLLRFRRALGLTCFGFVVAHVAVWALLDVRSLGAVWADIVKRPYITVGMAALLLLLPLALTSNDASLRRLGAAAWRRLHWLTYPAAVLGAIHFIWLQRAFAIQPLVYLAIILLLLATRLPWRRPTLA